MSWIEDLQNHLAATGHGEVGVSLFVGELPDATTVAEPTLGLKVVPGLVMFTQGVAGVAVREPMIELRCRAKSWVAAYDAIESAWRELGAIADAVVGETRFLAVMADSDIEDEDRDANERQEFVARLKVWL